MAAFRNQPSLDQGRFRPRPDAARVAFSRLKRDKFNPLQERERSMPLHVSKFERLEGADRNALGMAALEACRSARSIAGVNNSRFYWVNPNEIAILTDAEPGSWGPGSGNAPDARNAKAAFALADLARQTVNETWVDARAGQENYTLTQS
jgi:hypothetical protein